jgi:hypothetical protein
VKVGLTTGGLKVLDYFTPSNQEKLNDTDGDFGSGAPILLPDQPGGHPHLLLAAGKAGILYELDRDNLGKFHEGNAVQAVTAGIGSFGAPAYWNGHVYYFLSGDFLRDYPLQNGRLPNEPAAKSAVQFTDPGATPAISANGTKNGIVWVLSSRTWNGTDQTAVLYAYDAENVANQLYNSNHEYARDHAGKSRRFAIPTVVNGRVYVGAKRKSIFMDFCMPGKPKWSQNGRTPSCEAKKPRMLSYLVDWRLYAGTGNLGLAFQASQTLQKPSSAKGSARDTQ